MSSGMASWKAKIELDIEDLRKQLLDAENSIDKVINEDRKIKLDLDTKTLESAIQKLDKMLDSLGKGTGDFKQFENLSKELSSIVSEAQSLSKAFGKVDDSGAKTLLSSIYNIDKSLSDLSRNILNVNKNMSNMGGNTNNAVKQIENITDASKEAVSAINDIANAKSQINDSNSNNILKAYQSYKKEAEEYNKVSEKSVELASKLSEKLNDTKTSYKYKNERRGNRLNKFYGDIDQDSKDFSKSELNEYLKTIPKTKKDIKSFMDKTFDNGTETDVKNLQKIMKGYFNYLDIDFNISKQKISFIESFAEDYSKQWELLSANLENTKNEIKPIIKDLLNSLNIDAQDFNIDELLTNGFLDRISLNDIGKDPIKNVRKIFDKNNQAISNNFGLVDVSEINNVDELDKKIREMISKRNELEDNYVKSLYTGDGDHELQKELNLLDEKIVAYSKLQSIVKDQRSYESNISSRNSKQKKGALQGADIANAKPETQGMEQVEKATEEAVQAKKDFATANEGVQSSIDGSENPLKLEAELMDQIAKSAREAADAKKEFVDANKQVKDSADGSSNDLADGHSENAESSGVKKYKKKGYKAHDTGNHDNEKKVSNKAELSKALKDLQSEIIASIDESTSFVKEITDFYDSQDNLVKTQMKVGDKSGSMRTYTTSYSMDKDGNATAWTSHIETQKIAEQVKQKEKLAEATRKLRQEEKQSSQNSVNSALKEQLTAWKNIQSIREKINNTSDTHEIEVLQQIKKEYQKNYIVADKILKTNSELYNKEAQLAKLEQIRIEANNNIANSQDKQLSSYENKFSSYQTKTSGYDATIKRFEDGGWTSPEYLEKVQKAREVLDSYREAIDKLKANPDSINKESLANVERLGKEFEDVALAIKNMSAAQKGYSLVSGQKELDKIRQILKENSAMSSDAKNKIKAYYKEIASGNPSMSLDKIHGEIMKIVNAEAEAGRAGKRFIDVIKEKAWYGLAGTIGTYFGFNDIIRYGGEAINIIHEFDTALTEMRKVSDESLQSLKAYQSTTFDTADTVGTTAKQIQNSTADWMRLGESMDEAAESAKDSNILLNVSEFDNIDSATESLVSMSQAYKDLGKMDIIDVLNNIGNNYSISTDGLATALQDSASALVTANNDLNEAVALTTAGNAITQSPEKVGAGLRTISLRLVGTEAAKQELSDLGEETDGMITTVSKLRDTIMGATKAASKDGKGFDIFDSNGNYKSTYQIMQGLSDLYNDIVKKDKELGTNNLNLLLETIAGKNRSNIAASILQNGDMLRSVYEDAQNSDGSAENELNSYLDSVDGKMQQLQNRAQEFWFDLIDSETVKNGIDLLTSLVKGATDFVDTVGLLPPLLTTIMAALSFKNVGIDTLVALSIKSLLLF